MRTFGRETWLLVTLAVAILAVIAIEAFSVEQRERACAPQMRAAADLCHQWFEAVTRLKAERGIATDSRTVTKYGAMIGDEFTPMTTTLGSLEAKETSANPDFAALLLRLMLEAGVDSTSIIGVTLSGSFPSLAIATLAAAQTLGAKAVVISSLGASTYGANQPEATWIDIECYLGDKAGLRYRSAIVTIGGESDNGEGMWEDGLAIIRQAAARNSVALYEPASLQESIGTKVERLREAGVDLLVNIGGNQAAVGRGAAAALLKNGFHDHVAPGGNGEQGVVAKLAERGVPYIHLLNIKDLATRYGLPIAPGPTIPVSRDLYEHRTVAPAGPAIGLVVIAGLLLVGKVRQRTNRKNTEEQ